jgi:hypothetical protein
MKYSVSQFMKMLSHGDFILYGEALVRATEWQGPLAQAQVRGLN